MKLAKISPEKKRRPSEARLKLTQCKEFRREAGRRATSGGNDGNSFSPLTPFTRRSRRRYDLSMIFDKISSNFKV